MNQTACTICSSVLLRGVGWSYIDARKGDSCEIQKHHIWDSIPNNSVLFFRTCTFKRKGFLKAVCKNICCSATKRQKLSGK